MSEQPLSEQMKAAAIVDEFPHAIEHIENTWIPLRDGARLAARLWMPKSARRRPVPAVLEYIPYRKRDFTRARDALMHPYFAGSGIASIRVDLRGSGESDGVLTDEYLQQELDDGCDVIEWLSEQPWCNGNVGMIGISWGGFNGLQIAAMNPPALKAVVSVCSTDDRYADDIHHMGGCLLGDNLSWASVMLSYNSLPPDPDLVGDRWRELWHQRLEGSGLWLAKWLKHQRRDAYWRHGSVAANYQAIRCPVLLAGGWADGYTNAIFRMMEHLRVPRRALIGPWSHKYPHLGVPGPKIGFLQECVTWWQRWLGDVPPEPPRKKSGQETCEETSLFAWIQDSVPPTTSYQVRPGRWVHCKRWPSKRSRVGTFHLSANQLVPAEATDEESRLSIPDMSVQSPLTVGLFAGKWCSYAAGPDLAHDQREEDGGALVFETPPFEKDVEILGTALAELSIAADQPSAMVAVRLSDVAPDGKATRFTYGLLNLTHHDSAESPQPLQPGKFYRVRVRLNDSGQAIPAGHRLRLSLSSSYWPLAWPSPNPTRLTVRCADSRLLIPFFDGDGDRTSEWQFPSAATAEPEDTEKLDLGRHNWIVRRDLATDESVLQVIKDNGIVRLNAIDLEMENRVLEEYRIRGDDFRSPRGMARHERSLRRGDWHVRTIGKTVLSCCEDNFYIAAELDAFENDVRVFSRNWKLAIPRDFV